MDRNNCFVFWIAAGMLVFFCSICEVSHSQESTTVSRVTSDEDGKKERCIHIDDFNLHGNKVFSQTRLKMRMKTWHSALMPATLNCFNEKWLQKDIQSLVEFYRKKGYPDVEILYTLSDTDEHSTSSSPKGADVESSEKGSIAIDVEIREGLQYEFAFQGNTFFSEKELKKKIDLVQKGNLHDSALKKGKIDIRKFYLDAGFQDVSVAFQKEKTVVQGTAIHHVEYVVHEGTQTIVNKLVITGREKVEQKEIMGAMLTRQKGMLEVGGYNENVLKKDVNAVELLYLSKGFLNARIVERVSLLSDMELSEKQSKPMNGEGKTGSWTEQQGVESVKGEDLGAKEQQRNVSTSPRPREDVTKDVRHVDIVIHIDEGIQTLVSTARITGVGDILSVDEALSRMALGVDGPFREYMITSDENLLGMMVSEKGYPHVKVQGRAVLNKDKSRAHVVWHVEPGPFTRFGDIRYTGNTRLKQDVIAKRVEIVPDEPFSLKKVFAAEKRIRESSAVKYVRIKAPGLKQMQERADLEVEIEENMPYFVEAAVGYDTEQTFYFDTKIGDNNFLGREIDAWTSAKISGIGYRMESGLAKPYFLGTDTHVNCSIYAEDEEKLNQDFGTRSWGLEAGLTRPLFIEKLTAGLNLKYENRSSYGDVDPEEQDARNILITSLLFGYDSRDSSIRPTRGMLSTASMDIFTGFDNDLDRFFKYKIDIRKYISPFNRITFALRTRMGYIQPFGSQDSVARDQLFFLGGTSNVRGFKENMLDYDDNGDPAGGRTSINASLEARIALSTQFELNCFLDTGRIGDKLDFDAESRGFRSAVGLGLRYITPIGPVGLLYGHQLNPEEEEDSGRIHLSVGYTF